MGRGREVSRCVFCCILVNEGLPRGLVFGTPSVDCRRPAKRDAPPGSQAAPCAAFGRTAPSGFESTQLRACGAARFACLQGKALGCPRRAELGAPRYRRTGSAGLARASAPRQWTGLANTLELAAASCAYACRPQRWRFSPITSRRTVHGHPARHCHGASTPRLKTGAARCGRGVLACRRVVDLARVKGRAGAAFVRGCRAGPFFFRCGSAQGVLVLL